MRFRCFLPCDRPLLEKGTNQPSSAAELIVSAVPGVSCAVTPSSIVFSSPRMQAQIKRENFGFLSGQRPADDPAASVLLNVLRKRPGRSSVVQPLNAHRFLVREGRRPIAAQNAQNAGKPPYAMPVRRGHGRLNEQIAGQHHLRLVPPSAVSALPHDLHGQHGGVGQSIQSGFYVALRARRHLQRVPSIHSLPHRLPFPASSPLR